MKILQIIPSLAPDFGGPTNAVMSLSLALARKGHDVTIFSTDAGIKKRLDVALKKETIISGVKILYFPCDFLTNYKFSSSLFSGLKKVINDFDIVHIHSLFQFSTLAAAYVCRKAGKPYIIRPLGQLDPFLLKKKSVLKKIYFELLERQNIQRASAVHFTTEMERNWCNGLKLKMNPIVLPLGVSLDDFANLPDYGFFRQKYPQLKGKKVILFLSRINFKKGLDILIRSFVELSTKDKDLFLVIAGPDNEGYGRQIRRLLEKDGCSDRVIFTGQLLGIDKSAVFRDSDVFVLPSYSENFGIVVVEAMACGLPVVISDKIGIFNEIKKYNAGLVCKCSQEDLSKAILSVLADPVLRQELSDNAKQLVREKFDIDVLASDMAKHYELLISQMA